VNKALEAKPETREDGSSGILPVVGGEVSDGGGGRN
jgi:hypothetical protein